MKQGQILREILKLETGSTQVLEIDSTGGLLLPRGPNVTRPINPQEGLLRYNTDRNKMEVYEDNVWTAFLTAEGGTINGDLTINGTVSVDGLSYFKDNVEFEESVFIHGDTDIFAGLSVTQNGRFKTNLRVDNNLDVYNDAFVKEKLLVEGSTTVEKQLSVTEDSMFGNDILVDRDANIGRNLTVDAFSEFGQRAKFNNNVEIQGTLDVAQDSDFIGFMYGSKILLSSGQASSPAYSWKNNPDSGIWLTTPSFDTMIMGMNSTPELSITTNKVSVENDLFVKGDLVVQGNSSILDTATVTTTDNIVRLNRGDPGPGVTAGQAGLEVERGASPIVGWLWDETGQYWGPSNSTFLGNIDTIYVLNADNVLTIDANGALRLPKGPTVDRPVSPMTGYIRFNTTIPGLEFWDGTSWVIMNDDPGISSFVVRAGDIMTGFLTLHADPFDPLHAATKQYVDNNFVDVSGDTMTGYLSLTLTPTNPEHATTKDYVDTRLSQKLDILGGSMFGTLDMSNNILTSPADPTTDDHVGDRLYNDNRYLQLTGGTLTGSLILSADPTTNLQAATKQYVDNNFVDVSGDTLTGFLTLNADPINPLQAATKQYVDTQVATSTSAYRQSFSNGDLVGVVLTVSHNLGQQFVDVKIYDNNNQNINMPNGSVTLTSSIELDIDFSAFSPITGTWNVVVIG